MAAKHQHLVVLVNQHSYRYWLHVNDVVLETSTIRRFNIDQRKANPLIVINRPLAMADSSVSLWLRRAGHSRSLPADNNAPERKPGATCSGRRAAGKQARGRYVAGAENF